MGKKIKTSNAKILITLKSGAIIVKMSIYLQKLKEFRQLIQHHGGIKASFLTLYKTDGLKMGELKGVDEFGNRYYENKKFFIGRSRWVEFTDAVGVEYDATMIPPEWRLWLQYTREENPVEKSTEPKKWFGPHVYNRTGKSDQYIPYSTTRPKIQAWEPPK
ncbi:probable NADH dehydrogenase [ubiquinone] 1 alpha subcomplex subunit 12 [Mya arenaria]|uniref:probable NADH dehydrogenase [ubiquinone] 1 alpha subcomplex subunit 12 n=1 Tax=Mya arenaria TaxID=6604 RepID=UPI0022E01C23|nr:probable NADH dehydrogenase [ubiquinone] 1 alpha subcomplex subunit 12 [Mya arenaria]